MTKTTKNLAFILSSVAIFVMMVVIYLRNIREGVNLLVAFGTVGMTLVIVYIEIIRSWIQKPEIKIEFDEEKHCRHEKKKKNPCYYCHFMVLNSGLSQADDCEAVLEKIWDANGEEDHLKWPEREDWIPVNLKWSAERKGSERACFKTIYPGARKYFCDIVRVSNSKKKEDKFVFELGRTFISQDTFLERGKYRIQISIHSKNTARVTKEFTIDWCGEWKETQSEMQKCLKIKML